MSRLLVTLFLAALSLTFVTRCSANAAATNLLGVPSPAVQAQRHADLMQDLPNASMLVLPIYFADRDEWMSAESIAAQLKPLARDVILEVSAPKIQRASVPPTSYRYWGRRTGQYRAWLASNTPDADYIFIPEIYTQRVPRAQLFVLARDGTVVHSSSVHWGHNPPADLDDAAQRIVTRFRDPRHMRTAQ